MIELRSRMELRHLRYFLAVAEAGHFGRAAHRLNIVQPALSMQIRALEEELGAALFHRTSRRVELTEAGALLRVEAERTIAQAQRARSVVERAARGEIGTVRIAFAGNAAFAGKLSADLRAFHDHHPAVELELRELSTLLQPDAILKDQFDLAYCPVHLTEFDPQLVANRVGSWPWMIAMARDHPLAAKRSLSPAHISDEAFILYAMHDADEGQLAVLRHLLRREPRIVHRAGDTLSVLAMVAAGLGVALAPSALCEVKIKNLEYRPIVGFERPSVLVLLSRSGETSSAVKKFVEIACRDSKARQRLSSK